MSYVLVHLLGDEASGHAVRLTDYLRTQRLPTSAFVGEHPPHHEIERSFAETPVLMTGVCIGHGGPAGIGPTPERIWANASELGTLFGQRRLYAFACNTAGGLESLGARAIQAGVLVFVGHDRVLEAPLPPAEQRMVETVAGAAIIAFIDGQDDEQELIRVIDDAALEIIPDHIPLEFSSDRNEPNNWTQRLLFDRLACSLRVYRRAPAQG